ncbi:unnamed protein product [Aureobasidium uvarum]|uniref:Septin-type G domain-containing protein n=1 Tax=Aureobasidium uvarum TaxID=2773716 RepID=A0A9N8PST6_9PEZI|nr:unnamed protein product [Aureobasidium uvarum]
MAVSAIDTVQAATALSSSESDEHPETEQSRPRRRGSFSFLTRSKSSEVPVIRSPSGRRMLRNKKLRDQEERRRQEQQMPVVSHSPPKLPVLPNMEPMESGRPESISTSSERGDQFPPRRSSAAANFSRPGAKQTSTSNSSMPSMSSTGSLNNPYGVPLPPMPNSLPRTESIVSRGRETKGSGKTSFVEFLKTAMALPSHKQSRGHTPPPHSQNDSPFESSYIETDIEGERIGVTLWDSQGLEKSIIDLQLRDLASFVESKFEETFNQESRVVRTPGVKDTHIHCVLLLLDPARLDSTMRSTDHSSTKKVSGAEDEALDLDVIRALEGKTTVIPVVAKADTLTAAHMAHLKRMIWSNIKYAKLDPLQALDLDDEDEDESPDSNDSELSLSDYENPPVARSPPRKVTEDTNAEDSDTVAHSFPVRKSSRAILGPVSSKRADSCTPAPEELFLPFSILSPDSHTSPGALTRVFPWGEADPCNPAHCDYIRLRECVFGDWRSDLRVTSREKWYENWRTSRLKRNPTSRVRVSGGVTPITAVPKEGRTVSPTLTNRSRAVSASKQASRMYDETPERPRTMSTSKAERVLGSPRGIAL